MLYLRYILSELRRRKGRTILTSLGLAVGVGLVVMVTALTTGLDEAQSEVLEPLTGVGTDMSVSRPIVVQEDDEGGGDEFSAGPGGVALSAGEQRQLERENGAVSLDFSKYGDPGDEFTTNQLTSTDLSFPEREARRVAALDHIEGVGAALTLSQITISGTVPEDEADAFAAPPPGGPAGDGGERTGFAPTSVTGIDATESALAPLAPDQIAEGRYLGAEAKAEAVVSQAYAGEEGIETGDRVEIGDRRFDVVGIASTPLGGESSDFYVPLQTIQRISDREGRVNVLQVRAESGDDVAAVAAEIERGFAGAEVTTAEDLADGISGSLVSAEDLSSKLGTALAAVALLAAFGIASLLTLASVNKRTRELGTLKALGWRQWQVVRQVTGESVAQGVLGGVAGVLVGLGGAAAIGSLGISLEAKAGAAQQPIGPFGQGAVEAGTSTVTLSAPVDLQAVLLAIALAVLGGLIAGAVGGMRAARLRPAEALRSVE